MSVVSVDDLAKNPDFNALLSVGVALMAAQAKATDDMSPKERRTCQRDLKRIRDKLKAHHQLSEDEAIKALPPKVPANLGVSGEGVAARAQEAVRESTAARRRFLEGS